MNAWPGTNSVLNPVLFTSRRRAAGVRRGEGGEKDGDWRVMCRLTRQGEAKLEC